MGVRIAFQKGSVRRRLGRVFWNSPRSGLIPGPTFHPKKCDTGSREPGAAPSKSARKIDAPRNIAPRRKLPQGPGFFRSFRSRNPSSRRRSISLSRESEEFQRTRENFLLLGGVSKKTNNNWREGLHFACHWFWAFLRHQDWSLRR